MHPALQLRTLPLTAAIRGRTALLPEVRAVIACQEDQRVLFQLVLLQHRQQFAHRVVNGDYRPGQCFAFPLGFGAILIASRRISAGRVDGVRREVQEERLAPVAIDKFGHVVAIHVRSEHLGPVAFLTDVRPGARGRAGNLHEPAIQRPLVLRSDIPLADHAGNIAGVPHEFGHRRMVLWYRQSARHARLAEPLDVHARHNAAAAGRARRIGNVGIRAFDAICSQ